MRHSIRVLFFICVQLTLYLSTLEQKNFVYWDVIFHLGLIELFVKLKKITRNQDRLGSSKLYNTIDPERLQRFLKDLADYKKLCLLGSLQFYENHAINSMITRNQGRQFVYQDLQFETRIDSLSIRSIVKLQRS